MTLTRSLNLYYQEVDNLDYLSTFFVGCPEATIDDVAFPDEWTVDVTRHYRLQLALALGPRLVGKLRMDGADLRDIGYWAQIVRQLSIDIHRLSLDPCGCPELRDWLHASAGEQRPEAPDQWLHELELTVTLMRLGAGPG